MFKPLFALTTLVLLSACVSPQTARPTLDNATLFAEQQRQSAFVLERRAGEYRRVYDIAERLSQANVDLCPRTAPVIGIRFENLHDYQRDFREAARSLWGLNEKPSVVWVAAQSPAVQAGIRSRDQIISINGRAIREGRRSSRQASNLLREASLLGNVTLQLQRGEETFTATVSPRVSCAYQFYMVDSDDLNAAADGRTIYLNRGMLRFVASDEELALILGHELAHNAMRHVEAMQTNALMGTLGGALLDGLAAAGGVNTGGAFTDAGGDVGRMMFSQEFEAEADYVGMYFTARAGFEITGVEQFWRRMAAENPRGIRFAYTHPNTAERFMGLAAARAEIALKLAQGQPLLPNMRGGSAATAPTTEQPAPTAGPEERSSETAVVAPQ